MNLTIATQQQFNSVLCDFWENENGDVFMTRKQIGEALEYANPQKAIDKIHTRHEKRLNQFSTTVKLGVVEGNRTVQRDTVIYSAKGIYEICRRSEQSKADEFYDFVYDLLEKLRKGEMVVAKPQTVDAELEIKRMRAEAMLNNSRAKQAKLIIDMQKNKILSPVAVELLNINALEVLTEKTIEHRPGVEKSYTATELAKEFGISAQKIGSLANKHDLKTEEYGYFALDKSRYSNKQVQSFRYFESGRKKLKEIIHAK
ncbi:Bro-N domain-containing protein [Metasolibacillus sp.]|uniref:BRO-N domain-containing protein n=1 Tax=Metasolibacillus sp. TaxID=2703680 RepID=UPI0025DE2260|nr:Bro-N domain-containing protein [Metasolibacillus sp.]MCT6925600.1 Bro-N domain-containing protein [Metasolibacillus sp.]MCT6941755.1 Bro-N domain-containing protein [Metasolibacillus sp.]